jgi:hypothetical protein
LNQTAPKDSEGQVAHDASACPLCGGANACGVDLIQDGGPCWCQSVEIPALLSEQVGVPGRCICRGCVTAFRKKTRWMPRADPTETYWDPDGRLVFRAAYHLRRGYCCENGCRHCPYGEAAPHPEP